MEAIVRRSLSICVALATLLLQSCGTDNPPPEHAAPARKLKPVPMLDYTLVKSYPHDVSAFTEGLQFFDGKLYESTGAPNSHPKTRSTIGIANLSSGKLDIKAEIDRNTYFGEGIVIVKNKLYWVTYENQVGFIYDPRTFARLGQFGYQNKQGWGLTTDGTHIIMSDGTFNLTYLDPETFAVVKTLPVTESGFATDLLNELEYVNGFIFANVWTKNNVVKIDPSTGEVVGKLDLTALYDKARSENINLQEMNGLAWDSTTNHMLVTGKFWPSYYEIEIKQ